MKKLLLVALLLTATPAFAENGPPAGGPPPAQNGQGPSQEMREQKFAEHKAKILEHISQHIAEAQKRQACVQSAQNRDAMRACLPEKGQGRFGGHRGGSEGGEQGQPG